MLVKRPNRWGRNACCVARNQLMKARYPSIEAAEEEARKRIKTAKLEVYECRVIPGTYHLRSKKGKK